MPVAAAVRTVRSLLLDDIVSPSEFAARNARLGMSDRQRDLNSLWATYLSQQYEACLIDWDGLEYTSGLHHEQITSAGMIGQLTNVDDQRDPLPIKYRRPSCQYALVPTIVDRFTGMLFSEQRHPTLRTPDQPDVESLLVALAEATRFWPMMMLARTFGGAQGTVVVGAKIVDGRPRIEVHDPRWCEPVFEDPEVFRVASMEKRYYYPKETRDPQSGRFIVKHYWYRRIIDSRRDVVFAPVEVTEKEPRWTEETVIEHGLGFCPVVWAQNLALLDSLDGLPDCPPPVYDLSHQIDMLLSQGNKGTLYNSDPTFVLKAAGEIGETIKKGSGTTLTMGTEDDAKLLEMVGGGAKAALASVRELRALALEMAQCVLENPDIGDRATATEVERAYSLMLVKSGKLREQYSKFVVKPLTCMLVKTIDIVLSRGQKVILRTKLGDASMLAEKVHAAGVALDPEGLLELEWPRYFEISLGDVLQAVNAVALARTAGLVDRESAVRFVAKYLGVKDVPLVLQLLEQEQQVRDADTERRVLDRLRVPDEVPGER